MNVSYVTPFYTADCDGRFGRFHDWVHTLRDSDSTPFEFTVHAFMVATADETLASQPSGVLGDGEELWATKQSVLELVLNAPRVRRELAEVDSDVVHLVDPSPLTLPPVVSALGDRPLVVGPNVGGWFPIRNEDVWLGNTVEELKSKTKFLLRRAVFRSFDPALTLSFGEYHRTMLQLLDLPSDRIAVLEPGVDASYFYPPEGAIQRSSVPELLYVGDLSAHKGYKIVIRAASMLDRDVVVRVIGSGSVDREFIEEVGMTDATVVEGFVERSHLPKYYRQADLHVISSIDETGPTNTQMEALACGTPVVATDTPAINEIDRPDVTSYFWPRTAESLAVALQEALDDLQNRSTAARAIADQFTSTNNVEQLASLYESVASE